MKIEMLKANMLAEDINDFIQLVHNSYENSKFTSINNKDKIFQIKLLIEEYRFQVLVDELFRINRFSWDEKYTYLLVNNFLKGISIIDEYVENNYNELYLFTAKLYSLKRGIDLFSPREV
ncbi:MULTISPECIES: hypothetical protein [unclassified Bacillus (in: firmicutes)]|uniref:hypothetical protein n=1 Tax=unclassified Bacillus (in: firmicutes) TaxID=185979 RepID=UPI000BF119CB|nr:MULTISPECIES: hypothetical protein [unclassified Bacillus (in: firmicutes)]PEJ53323.1 hypothetical protein CN692_21490 [Bacillus sp. AFS002410]PEL13049.1 hypothetical protein CN601_06060 [Bacillus sp. AFS017336]